MQNLSKAVAHHDNPNSKKHARDVAEKKERDKVDWIPINKLGKEAVGKSIDGVSGIPRKGFCFWMRDGRAGRAKNDSEYTRAALKRSRELQKLPYTRTRNGKTTTDYLRRKHGIDSVVFTISPWAQATLERIGASEREELSLYLAEQINKEVKRISGREMFGGGVHEDTGVLHFHCHIQKTTPKSTFKIAGPWTAGSYRISKKFPHLLTQAKRQMLADNLAKKDFAHLVDIHVSLKIDEEMERWIKDRGLWKGYEEDCQIYLKRKTRSQKEEKDAPLIKASLAHFVLGGIWPLAYRAMTMTMWRMIPAEIRKPVMLSIRTFQVIKSPVRGSLYLLHDLTRMKQPEMSTPLQRMRMS
jgi:hypothetical protein